MSAATSAAPRAAGAAAGPPRRARAPPRARRRGARRASGAAASRRPARASGRRSLGGRGAGGHRPPAARVVARRRGAPRARGARPRAPRASVRPGRAAAPELTRARRLPRGQVALEQVGGGARVRVGAARRCARPAAWSGARRAAPPARDTLRASRSANVARLRGLLALLARAGSAAGRPRRAPRRAPRASRASAASPLRVSGRSTAASGVASVPVGSETAQPQRAAPWSSARIAASARARCSISSARGGERLGQLLGVAAAGLGHRVAAAAAAAGDLGRRADHVAGLERRARPPPGATLATRCTRPSTRGAEHDRRVAERLAHRVGELEQRLGVRRPRPPRPRPGRPPISSAAADELVGGCAVGRPPRPLLQLLDALAEPLDRAHDLALGHPQQRRELAQPLACARGTARRPPGR